MFVYEQSFQGKRHFQKGIPCQDRCGHCITPNGWIAAVVADGVSASPLSEVGATIAVSSCLEYFSEFKFSPVLDAEGIQLILRDAFNYALRRIKESADPGGFIPFSKMTTLQALVYHEKIGLHWGQAGDGALIIRNAKGSWKRITSAMKNKEDHESPITLQDGADAWKFGSLKVPGLDSVLLTTDGVADMIGDGADDKEISNAVVKDLMTPPGNARNKQATDAYYQRLFCGKREEEIQAHHTGGAAAARLASITDDITVLLIGGLLSSENLPPEPQRAIADHPMDVSGDRTSNTLYSAKSRDQGHITPPERPSPKPPEPQRAIADRPRDVTGNRTGDTLDSAKNRDQGHIPPSERPVPKPPEPAYIPRRRYNPSRSGGGDAVIRRTPPKRRRADIICSVLLVLLVLLVIAVCVLSGCGPFQKLPVEEICVAEKPAVEPMVPPASEETEVEIESAVEPAVTPAPEETEVEIEPPVEPAVTPASEEPVHSLFDGSMVRINNRRHHRILRIEETAEPSTDATDSPNSREYGGWRRSAQAKFHCGREQQR